MIPLKNPSDARRCDRADLDAILRPTDGTSPDPLANDVRPGQLPLDLIDEASMESFPCSDPPCFTRSHA